MSLKVAFCNISEKILSPASAPPSASDVLTHCCKTNKQQQAFAGSLQVGLHHQEGLPGDGRSRAEFGHHQTERSLGYKHQRVWPAGVGPRGLCHPSTGETRPMHAQCIHLCVKKQKCNTSTHGGGAMKQLSRNAVPFAFPNSAQFNI